MAKSYEEEEKRLLRLLGRAISASGRTRSSIEAQLGVSSAYVSKILRGTVDLRVYHLLMLVDAVGLTPKQFFRLAYSDPGEAQDVANEMTISMKAAREAEEAKARQEAEAAQTMPPAVPGPLQPDLAWFRWMFVRMLGFDVPAPGPLPGSAPPVPPPAG